MSGHMSSPCHLNKVILTTSPGLMTDKYVNEGLKQILQLQTVGILVNFEVLRLLQFLEFSVAN